MGRPPCCDKVGIKKGPWTPEEDIILVSYIQEHGPGNWRAVPTNTGLLRCSKSCRLRWTNYLRPGIKRGNFTPHEEGMIIHLQALLGNKWAAIATYLPQRTDNDIKNYWNTHLKKKLKKFQQHSSPPPSSSFDHRPAQQHHYQIMASPSDSSNYHHLMSKKYGETIGPVHNNEGNNKHENHSSSSSSVYASSAENISRLLEGWMRSSSSLSPPMANNTNSNFNVITATSSSVNENRDNISSSIQCNYRPQQMIENDQGPNNVGVSSDDRDQLEGILSFDHHRRNSGFEKYSSCDSSQKGSENSNNGLIDHEKDRCAANIDREKAKMDDVSPPLSFLEKWLLDESAVQGEGVMELSSIF